MDPGIFSFWHIAILLFVAFVLFGPKRLPEIGRSLGRGMREFREAIATRDEEHGPELGAPSAEQQPERSSGGTAD